MGSGGPAQKGRGRFSNRCCQIAVGAGAREGRPTGGRDAGGRRRCMCSPCEANVFRFGADVFSFLPNVFSFRPDVFTFEGHVFS